MYFFCAYFPILTFIKSSVYLLYRPENPVKEERGSRVPNVGSSSRPRKQKETASEASFLVSLEEEDQQPVKSPQKQSTESQPVEFGEFF